MNNRMAAVKVFVNIEACGAGGREIVFQTGGGCFFLGPCPFCRPTSLSGPEHPWVARAYAASVPRPHISVLAQEVFQADIIPSDTDFRIYRDYSGVPGAAVFAWRKNTVRSHTLHLGIDMA